jgi:XTP/dITP diphosphohydrolase
MQAWHFEGGRLVVASHNEGKVREIGALLAPFAVEPVSAASLGLPEPKETGRSFGENAALKARAAAFGAHFPALADDSGLCVTVLNDEPGIYSARLAGEERDFGMAMRKVEAALRDAGAMGANQRRARFVCALALAWPDGHTEIVEGEVDGHLVWPPRGTQGFGYDPIFVPDGYSETFGEMAPERKHRISHRARAFDALIARCFRPGRT